MSRKSTSWGRFTSFFRSSSKVEEGTRNIKITEKKQCIAHYKKISHNNDMVRANLLSNFALLVQRVGEMLLQCPCPCRPQDVHQRRGTMKKRKKKPSLAWPPVPRPRILCRNFLLPPSGETQRFLSRKHDRHMRLPPAQKCLSSFNSTEIPMWLIK